MTSKEFSLASFVDRALPTQSQDATVAGKSKIIADFEDVAQKLKEISIMVKERNIDSETLIIALQQFAVTVVEDLVPPERVESAIMNFGRDMIFFRNSFIKPKK